MPSRSHTRSSSYSACGQFFTIPVPKLSRHKFRMWTVFHCACSRTVQTQNTSVRPCTQHNTHTVTPAKQGQLTVQVTLRATDRFGKPNVLTKPVCKQCIITIIHNEISLFHNSTFNKFTFGIQINITHKTYKM